MSCNCYIVPPHLLKAIAASSHNNEAIRKSAQQCLDFHGKVTTARQRRMRVSASKRAQEQAPEPPKPFVPEFLLRNFVQSKSTDDENCALAERNSESLLQTSSKTDGLDKPTKKGPKDSPHRAIYDAEHIVDEGSLPGVLKRSEGEPKNKDNVVNEAYDNVGAVLEFYKDKFKWNSIDNKGSDVTSSVHFGESYENAFWDPEHLQMVFGDGGEFLKHFTKCVDVIGHELTHAITEHTSPLNYEDQPGALNEHISDVFGVMIKQKVENETSDKADWLIGEGCLVPDVKGLALRSMKAPGTAYDDPRFGTDPQVDNMSRYEKSWDDNGGVHIYSGIPNKAFYLVATAFGGYSWEKAGQIWWKAMTSGNIPPKCTFKQFADVTVDCAEEEFGEDAAKTVRKAWTDVGVRRDV
ncbi:hypothetical protein E4U43_003703 [Claviceps pusilla]|uniref:Uncharacterized protein n=1 Tax=Claviceps pusilla TaxID=123648 RepID=A0A9P7SUE4_9HYPO|nr:hypothetical protein E4U43_003703 [Claviceps pusilla]